MSMTSRRAAGGVILLVWFRLAFAGGTGVALVLKIHVVCGNGGPGFCTGRWAPWFFGMTVVVLVIAHILAVAVAIVGVKAEILPGSGRDVLVWLRWSVIVQELIGFAHQLVPIVILVWGFTIGHRAYLLYLYSFLQLLL